MLNDFLLLSPGPLIVPSTRLGGDSSITAPLFMIRRIREMERVSVAVMDLWCGLGTDADIPLLLNIKFDISPSPAGRTADNSVTPRRLCWDYCFSPGC